jgi:phage terminase small subunit
MTGESKHEADRYVKRKIQIEKIPMSRPKETRRYSKQEDLQEVERYCTMYPWYRKILDDIHAILAERDKHCGDYHVTRNSRRSNRLNAA